MKIDNDENSDIKEGDDITLKDRPCAGTVERFLPLKKERWGFRSQKVIVNWIAYSGQFPPNPYQRLSDLIKVNPL